MLARSGLRTSQVIGAAAVAGGAGASYYAYRKPGRSFFQEAHADAPAGPKKIFPASGSVEFKLESAEFVNHNVKRLRFALPDGDAVSGLEPISSLLTQHTPEGAWIPVFRPYTPIVDNEPGYVEFMVKKYPNGKGSGRMHSMVPGDSLKFRVLSEFPYKANQYSHIGLVAGGSGITPVYQLIRTVLRNPDDKTKLTLVYANNTEEDILLKSEFDKLQQEHPDQFNAVYAVSQPKESGDFHRGYVTKEILRLAEGPDAKQGEQVKVLVSGPPAMTAAIAGSKGGFGWTQGSIGGALKELGFSKDQVFKF